VTGPLSGILALAVLGLPLFCILAAIGLAGFHHEGTPVSSTLIDIYGKLTGAQAVSLSTIPLFTFAGYLMAKAKTAQRLVDVSEAILGWMPGGLAVITVLTCAIFTTFTGGSGVTIVALGGLLLPELIRTGYSQRRALEVVTGSGAVGLLFPPALPLIVYGIIYGLNAGQISDVTAPSVFRIERFLFAGILPGTILIAVLCIYCVIVGARAKAPRKPVDFKKFGEALWVAKWELPLPVVIIALIAKGWAQIPEVAALTALYVFVVEVFVYRDVNIKKDLFLVTRESMTLVGAIFMKITAALILDAYFIEAGVPEKLFQWLSQFVHTQVSFLLVLNVLLLIVGCLMDIFSAIVVMVPLIVPAAAQFHIDPYHLGIIFLLNLEIGYLLPPAGLNLFIAAFRFQRPITELYRAVIPFILLMVGVLLLITYVPTLVWLPKDDRATPPPAAAADVAPAPDSAAAAAPPADPAPAPTPAPP
jgi:tripartite ATP-independent transporter DctM subunit